MEILLVIGQEMELRENSQYNLLIMEILHHIFKSQDPTAVAKSIHQPYQANNCETSAPAGQRQEKAISTPSSSSSSSFLLSKLKQEQSQRRNMTGVRHGNFASTWTKTGADGKERPVTAAAVVGSNGQASSLAMQQTKQKRRNRAAEPFIGSGKALLAHTAAHSISDGGGAGPATKRANATLHAFCQRFVKDCYGPFMKSLKNEFRRDSHRLEEADKVVFFRLVWFFSQWWIVSRGRNDRTVGRLIITMDVFTFNLVLNSADTFEDRKQYSHLAQTVALYSEMMHLLHDMYTSGDTTEHEMAMGLLDRLFYHGQEALDRLPRLLSRWKTGINTREYVCDLVELCYTTLKLLDANTRKGIEFMKSQGGQLTQNKDQSSMKNKIAKMRSVAAEFDVNSYFVRKIISSDVVIMYVHLLGQYKVNSPVVNHRIMAMFLRIMRLEIASPEIADEELPINPLGSRRVTLEPMLYNLPLITVMEQILNDSVVRKDKSYEALVQFCTNLMYNFWSAADSNPLLYVECLFRHPIPHRFCESLTNTYVDEEMRMMALRDLLREEQERSMEDEEVDDQDFHDSSNNDNSNKEKDDGIGDDDDDNDEDELEFADDGVRAATDVEVSALKKRKRALSIRRKTLARKKAATDEYDSDNDDASDSNETQSQMKEGDCKADDAKNGSDDENVKSMDNGNDSSRAEDDYKADDAKDGSDDENVKSKDDNNDSSLTEATTQDSARDGPAPRKDEGEPSQTSSAPTLYAKKSRFNRFDDEDSSDDELLNDMTAPTKADDAPAAVKQLTRMAIEDDDDDDD